MRACNKCKIDKSLDEFYKTSAKKTAYSHKCKECTKADVRRNRAENIERYRAYDRQRGARQPADYLKGYRAENPNKYRAHNMVNNAIRDGKLFHEPCEVCGSSEGVHAHHDDYAKPLNIRWLCPVHHFEWHTENGEGLNG